MLILNDLHIGFRRVGGTTPASQEALRTYLFDNLERASQYQRHEQERIYTEQYAGNTHG